MEIKWLAYRIYPVPFGTTVVQHIIEQFTWQQLLCVSTKGLRVRRLMSCFQCYFFYIGGIYGSLGIWNI